MLRSTIAEKLFLLLFSSSDCTTKSGMSDIFSKVHNTKREWVKEREGGRELLKMFARMRKEERGPQIRRLCFFSLFFRQFFISYIYFNGNWRERQRADILSLSLSRSQAEPFLLSWNWLFYCYDSLMKYFMLRIWTFSLMGGWAAAEFHSPFSYVSVPKVSKPFCLFFE